MSLAPIVLFVHARPDHTRRTVEALAANESADQSDLIVYADAARKEQEIENVQTVRSLVRATKGFRSVRVVERESNYGLARNIVDGVTSTCRHFGRAIVLEDDIETAPRFLAFMNAALDKYANEPRVWHVSGWNYPVEPQGLGEGFFWRVMNCWGWGTWANRWRHFKKDPLQLIENWGPERIERFNLDGAHDFWGQVTANHAGKIDTWAIFWYATILERNGLCFNPARSFVRNIGNDGSGENSDRNDFFAARGLGERFDELPDFCEESKLAVQRISTFYREMQGGFPRAVARRLKTLIRGASAPKRCKRSR